MEGSHLLGDVASPMAEASVPVGGILSAVN